jgi:hypothetical protein
MPQLMATRSTNVLYVDAAGRRIAEIAVILDLGILVCPSIVIAK